MTAEYWQRQCKLYFPPEGNYSFGSDLGKTVDDVNAYTAGWDERNTTRLIWTNGYVFIFFSSPPSNIQTTLFSS